MHRKTAEKTGCNVFVMSVVIYALDRIMEIYGYKEYEKVIDLTAQALLTCCREGENCVRSVEDTFLIIGTAADDEKIDALKKDILMQLERINTTLHQKFRISLVISKQLLSFENTAISKSNSTKPKRYYSELLSLRKMIYDEPARPWNMRYCASLMNLSTSYFQRIYEKTFGVKCRKDIQSSRLKFACKLLFETDLTLHEIAGKCGFEYQNFMRVFKLSLGLTPNEYRKNR